MEHLAVTGPGLAAWDELLDTLQERLRERFGIRVPADRRRDLARALAEVAREHGHDDASAFVQAAGSLAEQSPPMQSLIARITTGESYFFRDAVQMAFLRDEFLPALIAERQGGGRALRIWSAGTSEGQELYSVAMLLHALLPRPDGWRIELLGTDIHAGALRKAAHGSYSPWSFRCVTPLQRQRWFEADGGEGGRVIASIRAMVRFRHFNLADTDHASPLVEAGSMDLILCRNVFIYLDPGVVPRVLAHLVRCLAPGGVLLLSPSDLRESHVPGLEAFVRDGMYFFRKPRSAAGGPDWSVPALAPELAAGTAFADRVNYPFEARRLAWRGAQGGTSPRAAREEDAQPQAALLAALRDFSARKCWRELDALARSRADLLADAPDLLLLHAAALGNLGHHADALAVCTRAIAAAPTGWQGHFLRALLHLEAGDGAQARQDLKRALFLNADCVEAHYHLGCLLLASGEPERARKSLRNARELAARRPPETPVHGVPGMTMGQLVQALRSDAAMHG